MDMRLLATQLLTPERHLEINEREASALVLLAKNGVMIVGDIQRELEVLPAQMTRIIRALELRDSPLIQCTMNKRDRRKIDVQITDEGLRVLGNANKFPVDKINKNLTVTEVEQVSRAIKLLLRKISP